MTNRNLEVETRPITDSKKVWVAYTNSDCNEGRGYDIPIAICEVEATAIRLAKSIYVQGSDGPVRQAELIKLNVIWYAPESCFRLERPNAKELKAEKEKEKLEAVLKKAREAGFTDEELEILGKRNK